ncbi:MAG: peptidase [Rhodobacteraceae bacterium]|nr:MAG: peptidase [Paracoccaceae bacterium]
MGDVVALARGWIGTPYHHRASRRGAGADCLGLIFGIWRARYGRDMQALPDYAPHWSETGPEERLWQGLARHFLPATAPADGQLLLFRLQPRALAKHLGIQTRAGRGFIHTCPHAGVVEAPLSAPWARRIVARFDFPPLMTEME